MYMTQTITKRKVRKHRTTKKRFGGGTGIEETKTAVTAYIKNVAVQILNSIEEPKYDVSNKKSCNVSNKKFYNMGDDKEELFKFLCFEMQISFKKLKEMGGNLINERNEIIHPNDLFDAAKLSETLILSHSLGQTLKFEYSIICALIHPKRNVTRSQVKPPDDGFEYQMKKGKNTTRTDYNAVSESKDIVKPEKVIHPNSIDTSWQRGKSIKK